MCSNPLGDGGAGAGTSPGVLMGSQQASLVSPGTAAPPAHGIPDYRAARAERNGKDFQRGLNFVALGIPLAFVFGLTPLLQYMGWFLKSLFHEVGHSAIAIFAGHPALPKISLSGHAMSAIAEPVWIMRIAVVVGTLGLIRAYLPPHGRIVAVAALAVVYPLLCWTGFGHFMILSGGHLGELVAGAVCLWRCLDGEDCHHDAERAAYAMLGWYLVGQSVLLSFGLAFSQNARLEYAANQSFGLTNDYIRLADNVLGVSLESVGFVTGVVALLVPLAVVGGHWRSQR
ncbi:hypothetical protein Poly30_14270 [Planctomycetes bacterium Poly30]|uniref:M50 family peptidase n=1 Tax=Saltatorellus ferox TaxID=2528018 RepID=A0A518EPA6_9BACT|nr:hypothetical protein Poly30_14270 [Planctomycetes bacterium Poly30]